MKIAVFGGNGKQGSVITNELAKKYDVDSVDCDEADLCVDLANKNNIVDLLNNYDMAVCALPSEIGHLCVEAAVETGTNMVDLSFSDVDYSYLDADARDKKVSIITDAGIAPGVSNIVAGRSMLSNPESIEIVVGGVSQNKDDPFGYTITWSVDDLMEEYTRPARIVVNGQIVSVGPLTGIKNIDIDNEKYEVFLTDGLRSMLYNRGNVKYMTEKTLRWPGHVRAIKQYLPDKNQLKQEMLSQCKVNAPDKLIMYIQADDRKVTMIVESTDIMSAMARTTALSCAIFASLLAEGLVTEYGINPPEKLAGNEEVYCALFDRLKEHGVMFDVDYPFL